MTEGNDNTAPSKQARNKLVVYKDTLSALEAQPNAVALLQTSTLTKLVENLGAEACLEILPHLSAHQGQAVFDNELWKSFQRGGTEYLDRDNLICWMKIWAELGDEYICRVFRDLGATFCAAFVTTFAEVKNIASHALGLIDLEPESNRGVDTFDEQIFQNFTLKDNIVDSETREVFVHVLNVLWELDTELFLQALHICTIRATEERAESVRSVAEEIVDDAASEREERRARQGFMTSEVAFEVWWKMLAGAPLAEVRNVMQSHSSEIQVTALPAHDANFEEKNASDFKLAAVLDARVAELEFAELFPLNSVKQLSGSKDVTLESLLRDCAVQFPDSSVVLQRELGTLANMLMHTFQFEGHKATPQLALQGVLKTAWIGIENAQDPFVQLRLEGLTGAFREGVLCLQGLAAYAASRMDAILRERSPENLLLRQTWVDYALQKKLQPANLHDLLKLKRFADVKKVLEKLSNLMRPQAASVLSMCLDEFPVMPKFLESSSKSSSSGWCWLGSQSDIQKLKIYLNDLKKFI